MKKMKYSFNQHNQLIYGLQFISCINCVGIHVNILRAKLCLSPTRARSIVFILAFELNTRNMSMNMKSVLSLVIICLLVVTPKSEGASVFNKCLKTINDIPGCFQEILSSFLTIRIKIGPDCCKALLNIEDNCWSQAFPYITSTYPSLLRAFCKSPPPHQKQHSSAHYLASPPR